MAAETLHPGREVSARVVLLAVLALLGLLALREVASPDTGFHLRAGNYILDGHGWPRTDPFTYTVGGQAYIDGSWGYQVVLALLERAAGAPALVLFHCGLVLALFSTLIRTTRLAHFEPSLLAPLLLLAGSAAELRFDVRPELVSYTLLALVLHLLHRHAEGRASPLWLLPVIFLLWVNMHSLFFLGLIGVACLLLGGLLHDRRLDRRLAIWFGASVAVTLVNPYGYRALTFPLTLATRLQGHNVFNRSIGEFTSPFDLGLSEQFPFYPHLPILAFRLLALLALLAVVPLLRQRRFWCVLLFLPFGYLSLSMVRNMPLLVVACLPGVMWGLSRSGWTRWIRSGRPGRFLTAATAAAVLLLGARVSTDAYYVGSRRSDRVGLGWSHRVQPVEAVNFALRAGLDGRVLNHLNFGGYLMWARPQPVFIDGRLEVMGEAFFEEYRRILSSPEQLEAGAARHGFDWIILPYATTPRLLDELSRSPKWSLAYVDSLAAVFVRPGSGVEPDVGVRSLSRAVPPIGPNQLPGLGGPPRRGGLARWAGGLVRRERFPTHAHNRGLFHYFRGEAPLAAAWFAEGIRRSGGRYYEMYQNLGSALYRLGRWAEAADCYRIALDDEPDSAIARKRLVEIERRLGHDGAP